MISRGAYLFSLGKTRAVGLGQYDRTPPWVEAAWVDADGALYAWYHHESDAGCGNGLTISEIGALVSYDGGLSFTDPGTVLQSGDRPDCSAQNGYFAGGNGDVSVILDQEGAYFYFLFGLEPDTSGTVAGQVARLFVEGYSEWELIFNE